jgi:hypothetical protein
MWSLWMGRNKRRHGEASVPVQVAVKWVIDTAYDLWNFSHPPGEQRNVVQDHHHWQRPAPGIIKCNADASFFEGNICGEQQSGMTTV